jgi:hypothetical protein
MQPSHVSTEALFAVFPDWRSFARTGIGDNGEPCVIVEVPAPSEANVEHGLFIERSTDEITVSFDCYHAHFEQWEGKDDLTGAGGALDFIRKIVSERLVVLSWWDGERWCGSAQIEVGAPAEVPEWAIPGSFDRVRVRSWGGALNADRDV